MNKIFSQVIDGRRVEIYMQEYAKSIGYELYVNDKWQGTHPDEKAALNAAQQKETQ